MPFNEMTATMRSSSDNRNPKDGALRLSQRPFSPYQLWWWRSPRAFDPSV